MKNEKNAQMRAGQRNLFHKIKGWLERVSFLNRFRPRFRDPHFWAVQGLVFAIAIIHDVIEAAGYLHELGVLYFLPISVFFVPVVYAALNFGLAGSVPTAIWATIITIPNWILWHEGLERLGVVFQMAIVIAIAVVAGQRVDRETNARQRVETASAALRASEMQYHGLFESSPVAILVLDSEGAILDANPAASVLFGKTLATLKGMAVTDLVGRQNAPRLLGNSPQDKRQQAPIVLRLKDGSDAYLEPSHTYVSDSQGNVATQVLLRDITQEQHRQAGLKAYAASVVRAQEEERQRIARELHDKTIQTLSLLHRLVDSAQNTIEPLPGKVIEKMREAGRMIEELVKELRDFARALRPPILDDLGMVTSIRRLLVDFSERSGIESQLKVLGEERRLPPAVELDLFRIAQEAIWNVERHAEATEVMVTITFTGHQVSLNIRDNGIGFKVPPVLGSLSSSGKLGLLGMQERIELLGGELDIKSSPGKGASVTASVPVAVDLAEVPDPKA
jgi:PAS domain S-box-containing protein